MRTIEQMLADRDFTSWFRGRHGDKDLTTLANINPSLIIQEDDLYQTETLQSSVMPKTSGLLAYRDTYSGLPTPTTTGVTGSGGSGWLGGWIGDWLERWRKKLQGFKDEIQPPQNGQPSAPTYPPTPPAPEGRPPYPVTPPSPEGRPYEGLAYKGWKKPKATWW